MKGTPVSYLMHVLMASLVSGFQGARPANVLDPLSSVKLVVLGVRWSALMASGVMIQGFVLMSPLNVPFQMIKSRISPMLPVPDSKDRALGAFIGLAVGDALGAPVEFKRRGQFPTITEMAGGGQVKLPLSAWTDDTARLCCKSRLYVFHIFRTY